MSSIFKLISSIDWEESKINGLIPKSEKDSSDAGYDVYQFDDLEKICLNNFKAGEYPLALELEPSSLVSLLTWHQPNEERTWKQGLIRSDEIYADLVMNIYSFEWGDTNGVTWCKIIGE